ncbi:MAG: cytochrome c maturation protein CcmE [Methanosarcinaceae archaeon]|nr:cytochrome c maturation protein CcmE [Methanosarcinaceae archaeon]
MKRKNRTILGIAIIVVLLGFLAVSSFSNSLSFYVTINELKDKGELGYGETVNINGSVILESINWEPENQLLEFTLKDGGETLNVVYEGSLPNNFREATSVVVTGQYSEDQIFRANKMLVKCPSKYAADDVTVETSK